MDGGNNGKGPKIALATQYEQTQSSQNSGIVAGGIAAGICTLVATTAIVYSCQKKRTVDDDYRLQAALL